MSSRSLAERQVERRLARWYAMDREPPAEGWLKMIRRAIVMTTPQLAERLGVTRQGVHDLEAREADGSATLSALRKAAGAMNCDLVYAIVPRDSLADMLSAQARRRAASEVDRAAHTMRLESQQTGAGEVEELIRERADQLLRGSRRALWSTVTKVAPPDRSAEE